MFGFVNLNKPQGLSSRFAVDQLKKFYGREKMGHAGTLDPLATGVLVVAVGPATRLLSLAQDYPKTYVGKFRLGVTSDSLDIETDLRDIPNAREPSIEELEQTICDNFLGEIEQVPPAFSAVKVNGRRAYKIARKGTVVQLEPKSISVQSIEIVSYNYPELEMRITCSTGTYIRSLGNDIAVTVGSGAAMTALVRTAVGPFDVGQAISAKDLDDETAFDCVLDPKLLLGEMPKVVLNESMIEDIRHGTMLFFDKTTNAAAAAPSNKCSFLGVDEDDRLIAIFKLKGDNLLRPAINFVKYYDTHGIPV